MNREPFWMGALLGALMMLLTVLAYERMTPEQPMVVVPQDIISAYNTGVKDALKISPPSLRLEAACMELWAKKQ